jgi:hypothetical protein
MNQFMMMTADFGNDDVYPWALFELLLRQQLILSSKTATMMKN